MGAVVKALRPHPIAEMFPALEGAELDSLAADIKANGLRVPITLHDGLVLDGRNRLRACELAGVAPRFEEWSGEGSPVSWVVSINLHRRHLNESQRAMVAARAKPMFEEEAKERQRVGGRVKGSANLREADVGKTADKAAAMVNVSPRAVESAAAVLKRAAPEVVRAVDQGRIAVSAAADLLDRPKAKQAEIVRKVETGEAKSVREALRQTKREELATGGVELPKGPKRYRVLYADPPWQYSDTRGGLSGGYVPAADHYPTMSVEELSALDVGGLAATDAVLFCWATFPLLPDALAVVKAWGFTYKTAFVWAKGRANFGHYHDASAELLLVCTRGSCTPDVDERQMQVQLVVRQGRHSSKPEEFRLLIQGLYRHGHRIELFRRGVSPDGWDVFGNEAEERHAKS